MATSSEKIRIPLSFSVKPAENLPLMAFLFFRNGKLLESSPVRGDAIEFKTSGLNLRLYRVLVAPATDKRIEAAKTLAELERFKPFEPVLDFDANGAIGHVVIPAEISRFWLLRSCRVRGKVIKNFSLNGVSQDRGLCHARVHICEIDRIAWWISRIPDYVIRKIPEIVVGPRWPIPIPEPDPAPFNLAFDPAFDLAGSVADELNPQPLPPRLSFNATSELLANGPAIDANHVPDLKSASPALRAAQSRILASSDIVSALNSANANLIRNVLVENFSLFHAYFCYIPWLWPYFYRSDEVKLVYTDANGAFDTTFWYVDNGDKPDLYFWVEYLINGVWTTVYRPSVPCHTWWNYVCGSAVTIRVTDPRVRWECNDIIDGDIVWVKTIGSSASVSHIQQANGFSSIQGKSFNHIGLSDVLGVSSIAANNKLSPFGGNLHFVVQFGSGLPSNGMYYYRWSFRRLRNADLSPALPLHAPTSLHQGQALYKSYTYEYYDALLQKHFGQNSFKLGPNSVNGKDDLYIIPPTMPASAPVNAAELSPLWDQNTLTVDVDSTKFEDGLYEFSLEFFDKNGDSLTALPKQLFQVPHYATFAPSVNAPDEYLVLNGAGADAFKMNVRIDNRKCEADIFKIKVNGAEVTSDCCGFVPYPPAANVEISYRAYHANNLATFGFVVQKGTCDDSSQQTLTNASGMVIGDSNGYVRDGFSIYRKSFSPAQLLGVCAEGGKAAYAENLNVATLATNGYGRLTYLDAPALAAFALEPA